MRIDRLLARHPGASALLVAGVAYTGAFVWLMRLPGAGAEPLFLLGVFGLVFPALAWSLTRGGKPSATTAGAGSRLWPLLAYLALFALVVLGWGFSALNAAVPDEPAQSTAQLLVKLVAMVLLPAWLFLRDGARLPPALPAARMWWAFVGLALAFLGFQAVFGRGLTTLAQLAPGAATLAWAIPACWLWQTLEAGLCEEFLFRRVLQQKLFEASGSQVAAIAWTSLLFGLAHAPGLYLRGASLMEGVADPTPAWAIAYSIVMVAPVGVAFGVIWARTRSLWLLVPLHGTVDLLPNLAPFIRAWTGG